MKKQLNHAGTVLFLFFGLTCVFLWLTGYLHIGPADVSSGGKDVHKDAHGAHAGHERYEEHAPDDWCDEHGLPESQCATCNSELKEVSRTGPVTSDSELERIKEKECEHGIPILQCDECRYQVGVVKVEPSVAEALLSAGKIEKREVSRTLRLTGEVQLNPTRVVDVSSAGAGVAIKINVFLGEYVKQNDVLAVIRSSEFGEAKAAYIEARAGLGPARRKMERERELHKKKISSEADYLDALKDFQSAEGHHAATEKRLHVFGLDDARISAIDKKKDKGDFADIVLRAPRAGTITAQNVSMGRFVDASQSLYTIADLSSLWVWCDLYERDLAVVHDGLSEEETIDVSVRVAAFPDTVFEGAIDLMDSSVDKHTRTVKVRVQLKNRDGKLKPGMFATVEARISSGKQALFVPRDALLSDEGKNFVFQRWEEDFWVRRDVVAGVQQGDLVEIMSGVPEGIYVAMSGAFMLKSDILRNKMGAG